MVSTPSRPSRAACLGGRGPAERAEGIGQMREGGTGQRSPQQAVEFPVEDGGGDGQESMPSGVSSTIDERRFEGLARRAHRPADSRRLTAGWRRPR